MQLNKNQTIAVNHLNGPALVLAGPGSGKTAVLTSRIKALCDRGIPPASILVITFTKAASLEMKERFDSMCESILPVCFGTFHSCFYNILKSENIIKDSSLITGSKRIKLIKDVIKECNTNDDSIEFCEEILRNISLYKNTAHMTSNSFLPFYNAYEKRMSELNYIDFDDMLLKSYEMFKKHPNILTKWQNRFSHFLIDEAQDMNKLSYELIRLLSKKTFNLFMVGDDDQSIYGFRGADPSILMQFKSDYPDLTQILLDVNYRCPQNIVKSSLTLISNNKNRFDKKISTANPAGNISISEYDNSEDEALLVVDKIKKQLASGVPASSIAILYRNHKDVHKIIEQLVSENIRFNLKESMPNIYTHWIMQDMEAYFFVALGNVTRERLIRVLNHPNQFIARSSIPSDEILSTNTHTATSSVAMAFSHICAYYDKTYITNRLEILLKQFNTLSHLRPLAAINYIRKNMGYDNYLKETAVETGTSYENYVEILDLLISSIKKCKTLKSAIDHLYTLRREVDYKNSSSHTNNDGVFLLTLHSSKGLEFENVYIIGCNDGIMPSSASLTSASLLEEERRLFYVGITRSKRNLFLSYRKYKLLDNMQPSRFLNEICDTKFRSNNKKDSV